MWFILASSSCLIESLSKFQEVEKPEGEISHFPNADQNQARNPFSEASPHGIEIHKERIIRSPMLSRDR